MKEKCYFLKWWMLPKLIIGIILQYIHISLHCTPNANTILCQVYVNLKKYPIIFLHFHFLTSMSNTSPEIIILSTLHIKKQRHYFVNKGASSQGYGFSSGHVWMWELDYKESRAQKNWCFWTVMLEKTWESLGLQENPTSPS